MRRNCIRAITLLGLLFATAVWAQQPGPGLPQPRISSVYPMGGQVGSSFEVVVTGVDLDDVESLTFSHPGISAKLIVPPEPPVDPKAKDKDKNKMKKGGPVTSAKFQVTVAKDVPLGNHDARVISKLGMSNPRAFVVGDRVEVLESTKPHNDVAEAQRIELNTTVNAVLANQTDVDYYVFTGKAQQRVLFHCATSSIDSRARPQLELYDKDNRPLGMNRNYSENDALLDVTLPSDGDYFLRVAEFAYLPANADYFYRLTVTSAPWIDAVVPPAVNPGKPTTVTLYGRNLPGGKVVPGAQLDGRPIETLSVTVTPPASATDFRYQGYIPPSRGLMDGFGYSIRGPGGNSNLVPIYLTDLPVVLEKEAGNDKPTSAEEITVPAEIVGRIDRRSDRDWYRFTAKKGDVLYFELFADRIGSEMDTYFVVKNSGNMGNVIEEQDDSSETLYPNSFFTKTGDPGQAKFTAPADGQYLVFVGSREANTTFGPRALYRLSISRPAPDFRVVVMPKSRDTPMSALALQQGEVAYDIFVERRNGFTEPLTITAEKLPTGVKAAPAFIGTGSNWGTLILTCEPNAPVYNGPINIVCTATIAGKAVTRVARPATITWGVQPGQNIPTLTRLDQQLMLAVRADKSTLRLQADLAGIKHKTKDKDNKDVEVSATFPLYAKPGDKILIPVKALWQAADPRPNPINVQMEPLQSNMQQAAIGTQGNNPLALAKDKNDGVITVDVRATAAAGRYPIVLKGETTVDYLRDPNDKNKKSKANVIGYTTPLEVIVIPNTLGKVSVVAPGSIKAGTTAELTVKVDRAGGYEGDFKIRFTLPKEGTTPRPVTLPDAVIPAGKDEVKITIAVPADTKPGNVQNVVATAVGTVHEKFPISQEAKFSLTIAAAK